MIVKIIEFFAYTGTIAALLAAFLTVFSFLFVNSAISINFVLLVIFGTLTIYNIDHLRGLSLDESSNPLRVEFIKSNKILIYLLTGISAIISAILIYFVSLSIIPILLIPFLLGLLHRRIKGNPVFAAIYITSAWLIVTIYLPGYLTNSLKNIWPLSLIVGISLFCNAYTASVRQKFYALKHLRYIFYLCVLALIAIIVLRGNYLGIMPLIFFTSIALLNFRNDENYEVIYFDGLQLSGTIFSVLFLKLISI